MIPTPGLDIKEIVNFLLFFLFYTILYLSQTVRSVNIFYCGVCVCVYMYQMFCKDLLL